ncbi:hypothetical protein BDN72DRAFT_200299 [Pluteus cervinus]|uniref:Uncharacterized protein n=1 Tax=Pluteus cervinus TaxID=181527 RepID=A0ACD3B6E8_9AGAR|nr:hypothetical protein BDN72DRAFT_200299 [Pluteus cervinus]
MFNRFQERFRKTYTNDLGSLERRQLVDEDVERLYEFIGVEMPDDLIPQTNEGETRSDDNADDDAENQEEAGVEESPPRRSGAPKKKTAQKNESPPPSSRPQSESEACVPSFSWILLQNQLLYRNSEDEDEAPPDKVSSQSSGTPRKHKGVKRVATPGSARPRKRGRVVSQSSAAATSDSSRATTPTKSQNGRKTLIRPASDSEAEEASADEDD